MATEPDNVDSGVLGTLIAVLAFGVLATALAITALVRTQTDEIEAERSNSNETFAELRGAQEADLHLPPAYMDQKTGVVRLPIDRAMQMVVRDLRRNPESATATPPPAAHANGDGAPGAESTEGEPEGTPGEPAEDDDDDKGDDDTSVKPPPKPPTPKKPEAPKKPDAPKPPPAAPQAPAPKPPAPKPPAPKVPTPVPAPPQPVAPPAP